MSDQTATETIQDAEERIPMSYEEFLDLDMHAEWADGEAIIVMPPKTAHQLLSDFLARLFALYTDLFKLGVVITAPFEMRAKPDGPAREPDILFVAEANRERITADRLVGPADLIVEVVSTESLARDRSDKFYEYQEAGVSEYWILDPRPGKERADFYTLQPDSKYQAALPNPEGWYTATAIPGLRVRMAWLLDSDRPDPLMALAELRGLDAAAAEALRRALLGSNMP